MLPLREFQERFSAALFDDGDVDARLAHCIRDNALSAARRIGVYRNNLDASLSESLRATYPAIRALVGEDFFTLLARRYIRVHPSTSGDLHRFGGHFAAFVTNVPQAGPLPWIEDMARLEWAYHEVFHAAEARTVKPSALAAIDEHDHQRLVLILHPASAPISSRFPLSAIWHLAIHGGPDAENVDLNAGSEHLLVARRELEMTFQKLSRAEYAFVENLSRGGSLPQCAEQAMNVDDTFDLSACLLRQFSLGNVTGVRLMDSTDQ